VSPVEPSRNHVGNAAVVTLVSVVVLGLGLWLAAVLVSHNGTSKLNLGDKTFGDLKASNLAANIDRDGPFYLPDASGRKNRPIIVQHLGSNIKKGWHAFLAFPEDKDADCAWEWQAKERIFRAKCDHSLTAPADGKGLSRYLVTVSKDGHLDIDLNTDADAPTTTTAPKATTTTTPR
jgi:hypothetical protein